MASSVVARRDGLMNNWARADEADLGLDFVIGGGSRGGGILGYRGSWQSRGGTGVAYNRLGST